MCVEIAMAANGPYFCGMLVTACSIAKYARQDCRLSFNILDGGISDADIAFLEKRVRDYHPNSAFNRLSVNDEMFKGYPAWHGNKMAYARLLLPAALPDKDWCIYCDVDFLWLRDICELWEARNDEVVFIGTADGNVDTLAREAQWFSKKGFPFDSESYFCSGLCYFNLKAFREQKLIARCVEILVSNPDIQFPDQAVLNIVTFGKREIVSRNWQRFTYELTQGLLDEGCVVHHAGEIPWHRYPCWISVMSDAVLLWHRFNAEVRGISLWRSLRTYHALGGILYHRGLCWLLRTPGIRQIVKFGLFAVRKPGVWAVFEFRSRRLDWRDSAGISQEMPVDAKTDPASAFR